MSCSLLLAGRILSEWHTRTCVWQRSVRALYAGDVESHDVGRLRHQDDVLGNLRHHDLLQLPPSGQLRRSSSLPSYAHAARLNCAV
jgi:hypothetical protein